MCAELVDKITAPRPHRRYKRTESKAIHALDPLTAGRRNFNGKLYEMLVCTRSDSCRNQASSALEAISSNCCLRALGLIIALLVFEIAPDSRANGAITRIAYEEMPLPDGSGQIAWNAVRGGEKPNAILGDNGHVVFQSYLLDSTELLPSALFLYSPTSGQVETVFKEFGLTPDANGNHINPILGGYLGSAFYRTDLNRVSNRGDVVFLNNITNTPDAATDFAIYRYSDGTLRELAREGVDFLDLGQPQIDSATLGVHGELPFVAVPGSLERQFYIDRTPLAKHGDSVPGGIGEISEFLDPGFDENGELRLGISTIHNGFAGIFEQVGDGIAPLLSVGNDWEGKTIEFITGFTPFTRGRFVLDVRFEGDPLTYAYAVSEAGIDQIAAEGEYPPGSSIPFNSYVPAVSLHSNNSGLIEGDTPEGYIVLHYHGNELDLVARENMLIGPDLDRRLRIIRHFGASRAQSNSAGQSVFLGQVEPVAPGAEVYDAVFMWDANLEPTTDILGETAIRPVEVFKMDDFNQELGGNVLYFEVSEIFSNGEVLLKIGVDDARFPDTLAILHPDRGIEVLGQNNSSIAGNEFSKIDFASLQTNPAGQVLFYDQLGQLFLYDSSTDIAGDFDNNGLVNGIDFLTWQKSYSSGAAAAAKLAEWQSNYGPSAAMNSCTAITDPHANTHALPEPSALILGLPFLSCLILSRGVQRNSPT